jgi:hypothetical protein
MPAPGLAQFYLSFTDRGRWLGAVVVTATTRENALSVTWLTGLNPGGAVTSLKFPAGTVDHQWTFRLLTADEARDLPEPAWLDDAEAGQIRLPNLSPHHTDSSDEHGRD